METNISISFIVSCFIFFLLILQKKINRTQIIIYLFSLCAILFYWFPDISLGLWNILEVNLTLEKASETTSLLFYHLPFTWLLFFVHANVSKNQIKVSSSITTFQVIYSLLITLLYFLSP